VASFRTFSILKLFGHSFIHSFIYFHTRLSTGYGRMVSCLTRTQNTSWSTAISAIVLLILHENRTTSKVRDVATQPGAWSISAPLPREYMQPARLVSSIFSGTFWSYGRPIVAKIFVNGEVARDSGLYEFYSCAHRRNSKNSSQKHISAACIFR